MRNTFLSLFLLLLASVSLYAQSTISIIPQPNLVEERVGSFELLQSTPILISSNNEEMQRVAEYLSKMVEGSTWLPLTIEQRAANEAENAIVLRIESESSFSHNEAYTLTVSPVQVVIKAPSAHGLFYGVQTLRQLLPKEIEHTDPSLVPRNQKWNIPSVHIEDAPSYDYRGMHLDVARHFFPVEFIKTYLDLLAMHKMNRFHWHLTEDQGWRIEIKKYPKLTEIGAWRDSTLIKNYGSNQYDHIRYGGFYTQEDVKEIVVYAQERYITVIPEIEMPGHSSAAIAAYPELGCFNQDIAVQTTWGVFEDIYCPKEETFDFLEDVLVEVMELFPGEYIHIGGDEAPKKQWEESEVAQEVIKREGLKDEHELQSYFIRRIETFLNEHGRQIIGWDEILEGGLAPKATVMSWRGEQGGIEAAKMRHDVIMTPGGTNYFDHYQSDPNQEPVAIGGFTTVKDVYHYQPTPEELSEEEAKHVLGAQGNVWTEYMHSGNKVEYMAFPRATALAEVLWTAPENRDWFNFWARLQNQFNRFDILGINAAPHYRGSIPD